MFDPNILDDNLKSTGGGLQVAEEAKGYLLETAKWGKFLAILGFVGAGFLVLAGISMFFVGSTLAATPGAEAFGVLGGGLVAVLYIALAAFYIFPSLYLYRFADRSKAAVASNDTATLTEALGNLKSLYKFIGITTAVFIGLYIVTLLVAVIGGIGAFL